MQNTGTNPFQVVCVSDPAIDFERGDPGTYAASRSDLSKLVYHEGERPAVFHCRVLTRAEIREVNNKGATPETLALRLEACFARGLLRVENLRHPDGTQRDWVRNGDDSGKAKPLSDSALSYFDESEIQEIGMVIMSKSFLAKSSGGYYPLPDISRHAVAANTLRRAERIRAMATSESSKSEAEGV